MSKKKESPIKFDRMIFQLKVRDLDRAKKFYEEIFGFINVWYEGPEMGWTEFDLPGESPHLGLNPVEEGEEFEMDSGVFTIQVKNLVETKKYLEENEIETSEIRDIPNMISYFNMTDPEGNRVQIVSDPRIIDEM